VAVAMRSRFRKGIALARPKQHCKRRSRPRRVPYDKAVLSTSKVRCMPMAVVAQRRSSILALSVLRAAEVICLFFRSALARLLSSISSSMISATLPRNVL
jgi:hypothetical protein